MEYGIKIRIWGDYALFSRPEFGTERCSYSVLTPSAARGILEAVYWHPGLKWAVDKIFVKKPIRFTNIRRNEVKDKISARNAEKVMWGDNKELYLCTKQKIVQRASIVLRDVEYVIFAHFEMTPEANQTDNPGKFRDSFMRRLNKGACYSQPYLGTREFPAMFAPYTEETVETAYPEGEQDLGLMLYDYEYKKKAGERWPEEINPLFFHAVLKKGVLNLENCEIYQ